MYFEIAARNAGASVLPISVLLFGTEKVAIEVRTVDQETGRQSIAGLMQFHDPPNGEIIEQFRQQERATERRMVAVHKIVFPGDAEPIAGLPAR